MDLAGNEPLDFHKAISHMSLTSSQVRRRSSVIGIGSSPAGTPRLPSRKRTLDTFFSLRPVVCLAALLLTPGSHTRASPDTARVAEGDDKQVTSRGAGPETLGPEGLLPWKLGTEHRYLWLRDGKKVGETTFRIEAEQGGGQEAPKVLESSSPANPRPPSAYVLTSQRTYDRDGFSQRGSGKTRIRPDGTPLSFEESLDSSTIKNLTAHQETSIRFEGGKALVTYVPNNKTESAVRQDFEIPPDAFLYANQAVEHWAIFVSRIPAEAEKQSLRLYYPDFSKVFDVTFRKTGEETLRIGATDIPVRRYSFQSSGNELRGGIWIDREGRLVQVEFPNSSRETALRVILDPQR